MPTSKKEDVANKLVKIFSDRGLDQDEFESIRGEDHHLDTAIDHFREADADTDDYDYESEDYEDD